MIDSRNVAVFMAVVIASLWLAWQGLERHVVRSCMLNQWPYLQSCPVRGDPRADEAALRDRIRRNPGDAVAYLGLASGQATAADAAGAAQVVAALARVAPHDPVTLKARINHALLAQQWSAAAEGLVGLLQQTDDAEAGRAMALLMGRGEGLEVLRAALERGQVAWFGRALRQFGPARVPVSAAMPMVSTALARGAIGPDVGLMIIRDLKAAGRWRDAHAIWLRLWNRPIEALFNGGFEQGFVADGFDWEILEPTAPSKAGAVFRQPSVTGRGKVLQLEFTGRSLSTPMLRQHVVLLAGQYRLAGFYSADRLRSQDGLVWVVSCANDRRELGRSAPMRDTDGAWEALTVDFRAPFECDGGLVVDLRVANSVDATGGLRGTMSFDAFSIQPLAAARP